MGKQLQHDTGPSGGQPCARCGLSYSPKAAYVPCFEDGDSIFTWWARQNEAVRALVHPAVRAALTPAPMVVKTRGMEFPSELYPPNTALGRRVGIERDDGDD